MGIIKIHSSEDSANFLYRDGVPPECLSKLYWFSLIRWLGLMIFVGILMFGISLRQFALFWPVFWSALMVWIIGNYFRKRRLEDAVLKNIPLGWHLIYRFHLNEGRYAPELVPGHEFKDILQRTSSWHRFNTIQIAGVEKRRMEKQ
jgi:hypothetical protein